MTDLDRALTAIQGLAGSLEANIHATLRAINGAAPSPIRGVSYNPSSNGPELWCELHEQPIKKCRADGHGCNGTPGQGGDPTGDTAVALATGATDTDRRRLTRTINAAYTALVEADSIRRRWLHAPPSTSPEAKHLNDDDLWCRSCQRDDHYCEPISEHYPKARLCRWCGDYAGANNGQRPPLALLQKRHRGERITQRDIDQTTNA